MPIDRRSLMALSGAMAIPGSTAHASASAPPIAAGETDRWEAVTLADFLTPAMKADVKAGRLTVDCTPAIQAAIDAASGRSLSSLQTGRKLLVPAGRYLVAGSLAWTWRAEQQVEDDGDMRRLVIEGDGSANTVLFHGARGTDPLLRVRGYKTRAADGVVLRFALSGCQLVRKSRDRRGVGLLLDGAAFVMLSDVEIGWFGTNLDAVDVLRLFAENLHLNGGETGLHAHPSSFSNPNLYKMIHCSASGNLMTGLRFDAASNISLDSCAFEGNGRDAASGGSVLFKDGPAQGGASAIISNCYFENNFLAADVLFDWETADGGTAKIQSCSFQRTSRQRSVGAHIALLSAKAPLLAGIDACAFKSFGDYAASRARPAIRTAGSLVQVNATSNLFQNSEEAWVPNAA